MHVEREGRQNAECLEALQCLEPGEAAHVLVAHFVVQALGMERHRR
jgi:hypothetical protein